MRYIHKKCGGEINATRRQCIRCKKTWTWLGFQIDPISIRLDRGRSRLPSIRETYKEAYGKQKTIYTAKAKSLVSKLPKWPRWVRILVSVVVLSATIAVAVVITMGIINLIRG